MRAVCAGRTGRRWTYASRVETVWSTLTFVLSTRPFSSRPSRRAPASRTAAASASISVVCFIMNVREAGAASRHSRTAVCNISHTASSCRKITCLFVCTRVAVASGTRDWFLIGFGRHSTNRFDCKCCMDSVWCMGRHTYLALGGMDVGIDRLRRQGDRNVHPRVHVAWQVRHVYLRCDAHTHMHTSIR